MSKLNKTDNLADLILLARRKSGLNQSDLAKKMGTSSQKICRWEKGEYVPDAIEIGQIAEITKHPIEFFFPNLPASNLEQIPAEIIKSMSDPATLKFLKAMNDVPDDVRKHIQECIEHLIKLPSLTSSLK